MRIGLICEPAASNAYYRAIFPLRALERRGHTVLWPPRPGADTPLGDLLGCELVHCYRRTDRLADLRRLSESGLAVTFDNDDNYAAAELDKRAGGLEGQRRNKLLAREMLKAARLADLTTTPSEPLAEQYRSQGVENVAVIENHLEREMFGFGSTGRRSGVTIGWVAAKEHRSDLQRVPVADALKQLLDVHPQLRVVTVGVRLPLHGKHYEHIEEIDFRDLLKFTGRLDIGIAPLADTAFNRSRSTAKLKEYSSGAAMWLASPVGPYRELGEAEGGMLVADEEWHETLDDLIRHPRSRKRLVKRALKWAKSQTIDRHVGLWEAAFAEAIERAHGRS